MNTWYAGRVMGPDPERRGPGSSASSLAPRSCLTYYIRCSSVVSFIKFIIISIEFSVCSVTHSSQVQNGGGYGKCRIYSLVSWAEVWVSWHPTCGGYLKGGQSAEELPFSLWHLMLLTWVQNWIELSCRHTAGVSRVLSWSSLILSSTYSNLLLKPPSNIFISDTVLFRISIWFLYFLFLCWNSLFVETSCSWFPLALWAF